MLSKNKNVVQWQLVYNIESIVELRIFEVEALMDMLAG